MSTTAVSTKEAVAGRTIGQVDLKLEVVTLPVSDVNRAKEFYGGLGWRLDADFTTGDEHVV
jgi:predicted enzyme related to lactoylglutathione lyase